MQGTLCKMVRLPTGDEPVVLPNRIQLYVTYNLDQVKKQSRDSLVVPIGQPRYHGCYPPTPPPTKNPFHRVQTGPGAQLASLSKGNVHIPLEYSGRDVILTTHLHLMSTLGIYVAIFIIKTKEKHNSQIYFGIELYMFRTGLLSIIRSLVLYTG
jgi:hypothetical protein